MTAAAPDPGGVRLREFWLLAATFLVAVSGLIYELIAATLSSYLLGGFRAPVLAGDRGVPVGDGAGGLAVAVRRPAR